MDELILVDEHDNAIGSAPKLEVHQKALLHRAFSIFLLGPQGMLLQQRAFGKYHCGGLWTNSVCSHPRVGESLEGAAQRRLREELGIGGVELEEIFSFIYKAPFDNGLTEHEFDHVYIGHYEGEVPFNPVEVEALRWIDFESLQEEIAASPEQFTPWFLKAYPRVLEISAIKGLEDGV